MTIEFTGAQKYNSSFDNILDLRIGMKYLIDYDVAALLTLSKGLADGSSDIGGSIGFEKYFGIIAPKNEYYDYKWKNKNLNEINKIKNEEQSTVYKIDNISDAHQAHEEKADVQGKPASAFTKCCEICGYIGADDENYCPNDGAKLKINKPVEKDKCQVCGAKLPESSKFCPFCGAKQSLSAEPQSMPKQMQNEQNKNISQVPDEAERNTEVNNLIEYAKIAYDDRDFDKAIGYYKKASLLDNKNNKIFYNLGVIYFLSKQFPEAKQALERAYKLDFNDIDAMLYLAASNGMLKNFNEAATLYKKVLEIEPNNKIAKQNLAKMGIY